MLAVVYGVCSRDSLDGRTLLIRGFGQREHWRMEILRVDRLSKRFGSTWAVRSLSFSIHTGEVVGFLGQNGAGKSTTIKMLCNLVRPTEGDIFLNGKSIISSSDARHRQKLGAIVESPRFYPALSGHRNLEMLARIYGVGRDRVDALMDQVGLSEKASHRFGTYSMGMKQRLGLAAVLINAPDLIILDEPTNGLDPVGSRQIQDLIGELAREHHVSVLLCSHQLDEVANLCHRALVLHEGKLHLEMDLAEPKGIEAIKACFDDLAREGAAL
ncbi:MAG: ABC transporter ATP-binding protein [SAR324 cluster bacterium]|nr:ABC transporter ATP-binding protein [SAR324 cluster bacterium]